MYSRHFAEQGYVLLPKFLDGSTCQELREAAELSAHSGAGSRDMLDWEWCRLLAVTLRQKLADLDCLSPRFRAVQCTLFEKSPERNWLVAIHQDLSIPVEAKVADTKLSGWSIKDGIPFVHAPVNVLAQLTAVRVHLDPCDACDGPLNVVPSSHLHGIVDTAKANELRSLLGVVQCTASVGDALVMRPALLHASSKASGNSRRRVLHFLFGPPSLPYGLKWSRAV